jgi:ABC-type dipeptide/oligopeptide/nickel transport system permease subunit
MTTTPQHTPRKGSRALRRFATNPGALIGGFILLVLVAGSLLAPAVAPYDWNATDAGPRLAPPSSKHFFGTDLHGRDIFSRILYGGRLSLSVGLATVLFSALFGSIFGVIIGYLGGRADAIGSRAIDVLLGFPPIVKAILIVAILGVGLTNVVIAAGIAGIPRFARVVRGAVLAVKEQPYFEAARALGARNRSIMWKHLVPNILPTIIVLASLDLGGAIISTASLSFIGLGAQPPTPEWGAMLNQGREYMRYAPWMMIFPGLMLFLAVMSVNLLGDRLSQALDPRMAKKQG